MGPTWSSEAASSKTPCRLTRPQPGFSPVRPVTELGMRIEPPVSEAMLPKQSPAATATALPPEDAPGQRPASHGLRGVLPGGRYSPKTPSDRRSVPSSTAPAASRRRITVAVWVAMARERIGMPAVLATPAMSKRSFTAIGTPCIGPSRMPLASASSARRAMSSARSAVTVTKARNCGSSRAMRSSSASVSTTARRSPQARRSAVSARPW